MELNSDLTIEIDLPYVENSVKVILSHKKYEHL